jgi:hypothetical protein
MKDPGSFVIIAVFSMELPEEIGLENRIGRLVFEISLNKGSLDLD